MNESYNIQLGNVPHGNVQYADQSIPVFARWFGSWQISVRRLAFSAPELARFYDQAAPGWGRMLDRLGFPGAYEAMLRKVLSKHALVFDGARPRVLDCGVGTGALSHALARVLPTRFQLNAVDISPHMLERARQSLCNKNLDLTLRRGDIRALPFDDGVFDLVRTAHVLEHVVDPNAALIEMARVLRPGGFLVACITRRSALGMLVHLMWRTHWVTPDRAENWLHESGLEKSFSLSFDDRVFCRRLSLACVGRKPVLADARDHPKRYLPFESDGS